MNLEITVSQKDKALSELTDALETGVESGENDMKKTPSLRLKKWNATRWLGRSECLTAMCKTYEYVLEHFSQTKIES